MFSIDLRQKVKEFFGWVGIGCNRLHHRVEFSVFGDEFIPVCVEPGVDEIKDISFAFMVEVVWGVH